MPRSTLKLPKKTATAVASDTRTPVRKPIRGGARNAKYLAPMRANKAASTETESPAAWRTKPNRAVRKEGAIAPRQSSESSESSVKKNVPPVVVEQRAPIPPRRVEPVDRQVATPPARQEKSRLPPDQRTPSSETERPAKPARSYPPRGIARSTGARASPPLRKSDAVPPAPAVKTEASPALPLAPQSVGASEPPTRTASPHRGLPKEMPRLSKRVSELAACSRREADEWIENGWVDVDGATITRLGTRVSPKATIKIAAAAGKHQSEAVTILYNKPREHAEAPASGDSPPADLPTTLPIRPGNHWRDDTVSYRLKATHLRGLALVGRLDDDEGGMVVYTQEGSIARRVNGSDSRLEKEYHVSVDGDLTSDGLARLRFGLSIDGVKLKRAQVSWLSEQRLRFVVQDCRKGQIQAMCAQVDLRATDIKRVRIGSVSLGKLPAGEWRFLRPDERF
ncbi:MAG TPA: S4 domain-containing protein [Accumulibacter sp.]|nr:S4 domain-containing protein [Accumulibacter sp.]